MKISYSWLKDYINVELPVVKAGEYLTDTGLEVEGIAPYEMVKGGLKGVVVGEVQTCEQHPNADRLRVTTVDVGADEALHIVCGAPNVAAGQKVLVATVGTVLYTSEGEEFKIKKGKIRGEVSLGMICAEDELGLGTSHDGIMVLDNEAIAGTPAAEYLDLQADETIEIGLTPNRTDAMSHYGVARDLRAALLREHIETSLSLPSIESFKVDNNDLVILVEVENKQACGQYYGLTISGVVVKESPDWLKHRLQAIGINPTNNVVDATNFVLHELGHPLHAFDVDAITGNKVVVRNAKGGEKFVTLDEKERALDSNDLMIANAEDSMCIAGVFGGIQSGVTEKTKNVFLEAAWFDQVSVRKTARRHALNTDASFRYERGVDPRMTEYALKRVAMLIKDLAGGSISSDIQKVVSRQFERPVVAMSYDRINRLIGQEISKEDVKGILTSLDIDVENENGDAFEAIVPVYRFDVTREADVIEEILRIFGLNNVDLPGSISFTMSQMDVKSSMRLRKKVNDYLTSVGYTEIQNNSLTKSSFYDQLDWLNKDELVRILNPLSNELDVMRPSLLPGGLEVIQRNINFRNSDLKMLEFGNTYFKKEGDYKEEEVLCLWMTGKDLHESWASKPQAVSFYSLKRDVLNLLNAFGVKDFSEESSKNAIFSEGLSIVRNGKVLIELGIVNEAELNEADVDQTVYYAEINWNLFMKLHYKTKPVFSAIPKFPAVRRDLALLVDHEVKYNDLDVAAKSAVRKVLKEVNLFDVYEGKNLPDGKKSYGMSFILQDEAKTLTDKQVDGIMNRLIKVYKEQFAAELR